MFREEIVPSKKTNINPYKKIKAYFQMQIREEFPIPSPTTTSVFETLCNSKNNLRKIDILSFEANPKH